MMQQDVVDRLRSAQRHLVEAARAIDGASVHVRTLLEAIEGEQRARDILRKPNNDGDKNDT